MSLQWTLIAGFLYAEIALVLLMVLPIASPKRWASLFKSKFLQVLQARAQFYFLMLLAVLVLFCLDAIREMHKYSHNVEEHDHKHLDAEMQEAMRLFRAQRNFYISGFALFLSLVIRRLVSLILSHASLEAQSEAALKQAKGASDTARSLLTEKSVVSGNESEMKKKLQELEEKLKLEEKDKMAVKSQAENLAKEYDRLTEEHSKLLKKITASGDKKDD